MAFVRQEHNIIADILRRMNHAILLDTKCFFGGGTAIVLKYGEYRRSLDVDFICSDPAGYREIRTAVARDGPHTLVSDDIEIAREPRSDGYGIRMYLRHQGQPIKFEIVREGNIAVSGAFDATLGVPVLDTVSMCATKLLANADRWSDRSTAYRDAIDLGMLIVHLKSIPAEAMEKAIKAYGALTISRGLVGAVNRLLDPETARLTAEALSMTLDTVEMAVDALRSEVVRLYPDAEIVGRR